MKQIPLSKITEHSLIACLPRWADESFDMQSLRQDIADRGIDQPLLVVLNAPHGFSLVDGRHRFRAAQLAGLDEVPVIERAEAEAADIVLHSLVNRRHFTKGQQAYVSYPVIAALVVDKTTHLKKGNSPKSTESTTGKSVEDLCVDLGYSRDLFFQAKQVHEAFSKRPDLKAKYEPSIMGGAGLGAVLAGMAGESATLGKGKSTRPAQQLLCEAIEQLEMRWDYWPKIASAQRAKLTNKLVENVLQSWPTDVKAELLSALKATEDAQ